MTRVVDASKGFPNVVAEVICTRCGCREIVVMGVDELLREVDCDDCGPGYCIKTGQPLVYGLEPAEHKLHTLKESEYAKEN